MREPGSLESLTSVDVLRMQKWMFIVGFTQPSFFFSSFPFFLSFTCKRMFCYIIMPRSLARSVITSWYCMFILWLLVVHLLMDKYLHCMCHSFFSSFYCAEAKSWSRSWSMSYFPIRTERHYQTMTNVKSSVFHTTQEEENPSKCTSHLRSPFMRMPRGQVFL